MARTIALLVLLPLGALAEPDSFGLGDGRQGTLTVGSGSVTVNTYQPVTANLAPSDTSISVADTAGFLAGDLVMVLQLAGFPDQASGAQGPFSLDGTSVGRWELARVAGVSANALGLTAPLVFAFEASATQVVRVPEYTDVAISAGASLTGAAWNGRTGGVLAFLATGAITNDGTLSMSGKGMRGGLVVRDPSGANGCTLLDQPAPLGAQRGESVVLGRYGAMSTGYGNVVNGGGGGNCHNAGGGGGGNGGPGGQGGTAWDGDRDVGGRGGTALGYSVLERLVLGGGGGTAHDHSSTAGPGGAGGGAIFIRGGTLGGSGTIAANGQNGVTASHDGGSGGGAGGTLYLRASGAISAGAIEAKGGNGGSNTGTNVGRGGGGGGGGKILLQGSSVSVTPSVTSGVAGTAGSPPQYYLAQPASGSDPAYVGSVTPVAGGLQVPGPPAVSAPTEASWLNQARPMIIGKAMPGSAAIVTLDGAEAQPVIAAGDGAFSFVPAMELADGLHALRVVAEFQALRGPSSAERTFQIDTLPPDTLLTSTPPPERAPTSVTFGFDASETASRFECSLDGAAFTACASPLVLDGLAERAHGLDVRAIDRAGNVDPTPAHYAWTTGEIALAVGCGCGNASAPAGLLALLVAAALRRSFRWKH